MKNLQYYISIYKKDYIQKLLEKNNNKNFSNKVKENKNSYIDNDNIIYEESNEDIFYNSFIFNNENISNINNKHLIDNDKLDLKNLFSFCKKRGGKFDNFIVNYLDYNNRYITSKEKIVV
jgi:hypothetical protein